MPPMPAVGSPFGKQVHTRGIQVTHRPDKFYLVVASGVLSMVDHIRSITCPQTASKYFLICRSYPLTDFLFAGQLG